MIFYFFLLLYKSDQAAVESGTLELPDKNVEYEVHKLDTNEIEHADNESVRSWFETTETGKCGTKKSFPTPTSLLEMEAYAELLKKVSPQAIQVFSSKFL